MGEDTVQARVADALRQIIERYEQLDEEKREISEKQKELMVEAKGAGYDTTAIREIIKLRRREPDAVAEQDAIVEFYKQALGMS